jgi:Rab-like protein 3
MSGTTDRARILVLGDSGVGKTSLVHLIAHGKPLSQISYTVGAAVEVKLHEYREGTAAQKPYWIGKFLLIPSIFNKTEFCGKFIKYK